MYEAERLPGLTRLEFAPNCVWTFPVPDANAHNEALLAWIREERRRAPEGRACEGRDMWQGTRPVQEEPLVRRLFDAAIFPAARRIAAALSWDVAGLVPTCPVCWANVHPRGGFHTRHVHPATEHLSGVYYIQAGGDGGRIIFHDLPRFLGLWGAAPRALEPNRLNVSRIAVEPKAGLCVLFPAYLMHEVEVNRGDEDRVGLAFNLRFASGSVG
jgi:uncharacterized protein (TIGR02466 family)